MSFNLKRFFSTSELSPEERREVLEGLFVFGKESQRPFLVRMSVLLVLSTIIATAGLLSDSAAVVIGAMLVAPLMNPVMASAGAVVMGWPKRFSSAAWLLVAMGTGAVILSAFITAISPEIVFLPEQVLARTRPTYYDLIIALAAGSAGAYTITRKESVAIPGVAVAVALLPPLAATGILLVTGEFALALRAIILFSTNLVAIVLAGALTFMACGVAPVTARRRSAAFIKNKLLLFTMLIAAISVPLWFYSQKIIFNPEYRAAQSQALQTWLKDNNLKLVAVNLDNREQTLFLGLEGPNPPISIGSLYDDLMKEARLDNEPTSYLLKYSWTQRVDGAWPVASEHIDVMARDDFAGKQLLSGSEWVWEHTQYDANRGSRPPESDRYMVQFENDGKLSVKAACGTKSGTYSTRGDSIEIRIKRFNRFSCRDDQALQVFFGDLQRSSEFFIEEGKLHLSLRGGSENMYFKSRQ